MDDFDDRGALHYVRWIGWAKMGIPYALGDDLATGSIRGLLGEQPTFTFSAEGVARQTIAPMFQAGGHVVGLDIRGQPDERPRPRCGTLSGTRGAGDS